ncbi:MAG: translation initiation factor IF-2 subunit gamma [Thermofilum sp.]|jgi:translation initiation factor 2 subunit 3|nr:translation initiation factor IF-2 subunit gamma [Thermofilum sp.]
MSIDDLAEAARKQPLVNIGTAGHVDHGKTTLVEALTGVWASRHSEEIKRGITLKIGYADAEIYRCPNCPPPQAYYTNATMPKNGRCKYCGSQLEFVRKVSFVDVPGHEMLMSVMLAGAALMDGALLVIDATKECPQPQTREHFTALSIIGVKNLVIVQNKVDVVSKERAKENYEEIRKFIEGTFAENAPIIPVSALHKVNIDVLVWALEKYIPTPTRNLHKPPRMLVVRSFDVNKPGTSIKDMVGGVIGGTIIQGKFELGHEIEVRPGIKLKKEGQEVYEPVYTTITSLMAGTQRLEKAYPGGLIAVGTTLDPSLTKADALIGNVVGYPDTLPPTLYDVEIDAHLLERVVGMDQPVKVDPVKAGEILMINVGTSLSIGQATSVRDNIVHLKLKIPVVAETGTRVAISRQIAGKWRLIAYGYIR